MHMIGHDHECIEAYLRSHDRASVPFRFDDFSELIQRHRSVDDRSENRLPIRRANGYEINPGLSVVESF